MVNKDEEDSANNAPLFTLSDYFQLWFILTSMFLYGVVTWHGGRILDPELSEKLNQFYNLALISKTWSIFIWGWLTSILLKVILRRLKGQYWGYWSILSFSIFGSVVVSVLTVEDGFNSPYLIAFGMTLAHLGFWTWSKENKEKQQFNKELRESVDKVKSILDIMPDVEAFDYSADGYIAARRTIALLYQYALPKLHKKTPLISEELTELINICESGIINILIMISSICRAWTKERSQYFESNIMLLRTITEVEQEDKQLQDCSFKNGKVFFKDGIKSAKEASEEYCSGFLMVDTPLCHHTRYRDFKVEPKLLPIRQRDAKKDTETIPGAPEACEHAEPVMILDCSKFGDPLKTFKRKQKIGMIDNLYSRGRFDSIISLPIPYPKGICEQLHIEKPLYIDRKCMGTINLYRHEKGGVKDVHLLYNFCMPLLHIAADLLILREYLRQKENDHAQDESTVQRQSNNG